MAAARGLLLVRELLRPQRNTTSAHRLRGMGVVVGATAGFLIGSAAAASASDGGAASACPAYPWPQDGRARGGTKVFMQHDCAACHSALPYSVHAEETSTEAAVEPRPAEIVVVHAREEAARPPPALHHGAACPPEPDLSVIAGMLEGIRRSNLYNADELKKRTTVLLPSPAWLQFLQPYYTRTPHAA
ncbi:hypothetical protein U9M48_021523 [Paspalum notatum var. saurae]|uniref:Cytochrome c domain-containing protein n=1 Tax=Paspalum notatum var. saurae TaxID=547442 RepID=A0AAQ3WTN6_PASNO